MPQLHRVVLDERGTHGELDWSRYAVEADTRPHRPPRIETSNRLGRHRWVMERTVAWLGGFRRLHRRYERKADHFAAFAGSAAAIIRTRRLPE